MITNDQDARARKLIRALRDKKSWPKGFVWRFQNFDADAIGLAARLHLIPEPKLGDEIIEVADLLGMSLHLAQRIFEYGGGDDHPSRTVSPKKIAGLLDNWLQMQNVGEPKPLPVAPADNVVTLRPAPGALPEIRHTDRIEVRSISEEFAEVSETTWQKLKQELFGAGLDAGDVALIARSLAKGETAGHGGGASPRYEYRRVQP